MHEDSDLDCEACDRMARRVAELEAENARLRAGLEAIILHLADVCPCKAIPDCLDAMSDLARAAVLHARTIAKLETPR